MLRVAIQKEFDFDPGTSHTADAAAQLCIQNSFDPVCEYLDGLTWDGTPRLDAWLHTYMGAEDTELNRQVGRLALIAAVRRARHPGTKFDQIPVFEGVEGTNKSTAIKILAGAENFSDQTILGLGDREQQEAVQGIWLYEIADLTGMGRSDIESVKAFASRTHDRARPAYGRFRVNKPRRCIFFATTNEKNYLKSQTGNRRFWPVKTGDIDVKALGSGRDQLWAEAATLEAEGVSIVLPESLWSVAREIQESRREVDPWEDILAEVRGTRCGDEDRVFSQDLLSNTLKIPTDRLNNHAMTRLANCMKQLAWQGPKPMRIGVERKKGYFRPAAGPAPLSLDPLDE